MNITHKFTTDLQNRGITERIHAMQSDGGTRIVEVTLLSGGAAWQVPAGTSVSVAFRNLKDGHKGWYDKLPNGDAACTVNSNVVTAVLAPAVLSGDGEVQAAIVFQDANLNQLATFGFSILVEKNPAAGVSKQNDYYAYSTMEQVSQAVDAMLDSLMDTKAQLGQLVTQVNAAVAQVAQEAGAAIVCQRSGEVIAVTDASDRTLQGLALCGRTTQTGTPSPVNPVPLVSAGDGGSIGVTVAGLNLLDMTQVQEGTATPGALKNAIITADCIDIVRKSAYDYASIPVHLIGGKTYTLWYQAEVYDRAADATGNTAVRYGFESQSKAQINTNSNGTYYAIATMTPSADMDDKVLVYANYGSTTPAKVRFKVMLLEGAYTLETVPPFEPYKGQTITLSTPNGLPGLPVASGGNYIDSNGQQWICDEIDLARGVYVQRVGKVVYDGDETAWTTYGEASGNLNFLIYPTNVKAGWQMSQCDHFQNVTMAWDTSNSGKYGIYADHPSVTGKYFRPPNSAVTTLAQWKAWLTANPITLIYALAEPVETPLDADTLAAYAALHSNKPSTTVFNDAGAGQELSYVADTKLYIDQKFTEVTNAIVAAIGTI